ncbi:uncharacterized protein F5891DRAFT_1197855 [Suillus fuscotomentosus]|uniref:Uncharacterized protein n=1 Tax=Suillus fuscotomentosus TaxID=1912939 RepID=A0AAD4DRF9_9AGAM|nr:uncharacterized protein F5891DRAFT_1197855 [Suillus fuscotomentosus]KAG1890699.1 hypothetical protein F5891DRAFT_1197855 [Suillus fuscotomentosus]
MPALRPRLRRSARLQIQSQIISPRRCKTGLKFMEPPPAPPARGKGKRGRGGKDRATTSPTISISWQAVPQRTNRLVDYLVGHPPDCRILFASEKKNPANREAEGRPSGKDKNEIHTVIARVIFSDDPQYAVLYASNPNKFWDSVYNHIVALCTKFRDIHAEFESTGAGIMPIDSETSVNLHRKYEKDFPWYNQLYSIWGSHPSFSAKTSLSKPGIEHASDLFSLTRPSGGSLRPPASSSTDPGSPMQLGNTPLPNAPAGGVAGSSTEPTYDYLPPNAHAGGAAAAALPTSPFCHTPPAPGGSGGSPSQWNYVPPPPSTHTNSSAGSPVFRYPPLPSGATSHDSTYSPVAHSPTDDYNFDGIYDDNPLVGEMEDLNMDSPDEIIHDDSNTISLDSPPRRRAGKKRQEPPSPPSPTTTSHTQQVPPRTSVQHDRATFKSHVSQVMMCEKSKSGSMASSGSRSSSHSRKPSSSHKPSSQQSSPTAQTSVSTTPASSVSKRLWMEIHEQMDALNDDLESIHSDKLTLYQLKNERLMVKLNASRQDKEHHLMCEERMDERADAAIVHRRMKEAKEVDIRLREADAAAFASEADVLRLRIQWAQLNAQGGKPACT